MVRTMCVRVLAKIATLPVAMRRLLLLRSGADRLATAMLALALLAAASPASAAGNLRTDDHDAALALVEAGTIRPLSDILAGLATELHGRIIEVALESEHGTWIYE